MKLDVNIQNKCLLCYGDLDANRKCVRCRKKANDIITCDRQLKPRTVLKDRYLIGNVLGAGGFGISYLAWDLQSGQKVAIKEYFPESNFFRDEDGITLTAKSADRKIAVNKGLKLFTDEAKNMIKIKDLCGIVTVLDFFSANNTAYIVMEYLSGVTLKSYLKHGKLSLEESISLLQPVLKSLAKLHEMGLLHRDISPENIMITETHEVKLIDFGASKQYDVDDLSLAMVLKKGYAPEEQYRPLAPQGQWTDIYALGVTIYYCITKQLPPESVKRKTHDEIKYPSLLCAKITPRQQDGLMKALAVDAQDRCKTLIDFICNMGFNVSNDWEINVKPFPFSSYEKTNLFLRLFGFR